MTIAWQVGDRVRISGRRHDPRNSENLGTIDTIGRGNESGLVWVRWDQGPASSILASYLVPLEPGPKPR